MLTEIAQANTASAWVQPHESSRMGPIAQVQLHRPDARVQSHRSVCTGPAAWVQSQGSSCTGPAARVPSHGSSHRGPITHIAPDFKLFREVVGQVTTIFRSVSNTQRKQDTRKDTEQM